MTIRGNSVESSMKHSLTKVLLVTLRCSYHHLSPNNPLWQNPSRFCTWTCTTRFEKLGLCNRRPQYTLCKTNTTSVVMIHVHICTNVESYLQKRLLRHKTRLLLARARSFAAVALISLSNLCLWHRWTYLSQRKRAIYRKRPVAIAKNDDSN